jgi:hypothetical protein
MVAGEMFRSNKVDSKVVNTQMPDGSSMPDSEILVNKNSTAPQDSGDFMNQIQNAMECK